MARAALDYCAEHRSNKPKLVTMKAEAINGNAWRRKSASSQPHPIPLWCHFSQFSSGFDNRRKRDNLHFLLEKDNEEDREEIEDIEFEFLALQDRLVTVTTEIVVSNKPLTENQLPGRGVFLRRESVERVSRTAFPLD